MTNFEQDFELQLEVLSQIDALSKEKDDLILQRFSQFH